MCMYMLQGLKLKIYKIFVRFGCVGKRLYLVHVKEHASLGFDTLCIIQECVLYECIMKSSFKATTIFRIYGYDSED